MKKVIFLVIIFIFAFQLKVSADEKNLEQQFLDGTASHLDDNVTNDVEDYFNDNGISIEDSSSFTKMSIKDVFAYIFKKATGVLKEPIRLLGALIGVILLFSIIEGLETPQSSSSLTKVFDIISVLICITIIYKSISGCFELVANTLSDGGNFMIAFVPVFASVIGASGSITSAGIYNIAVLFVAEAAVHISVTFLMPMLGIYMAMTIIEAINPALCLSGLTNGIKKAVQWALGFIMTVFVGLITIQSIVGVSADTVGIRAAKFVASSFIPVIGGAISEAYTTVKGSIGLLRSGVGTFGIIVLLITVIPPLLYVIAIKISISLASFVGEILGATRVTILLKSTSSVLSIAISILACFVIMLIMATTILMLVSMSIG